MPARSDALTQLDSAPRHVTGHRRANTRPPEREIGALDVGRGCLHIGIVRNARLSRESGTGREILLCRNQSIPGGAQRIPRVGDFLGRDRAAACQILAAVQIRLRLAQIRPSLRNHRFQLVAVRKHGAHLADRPRKLRLGVAQRDLRIGVIELDQLLAALNEIGLVGTDTDDRPAHL